jgi:hypothetical protein
MTGKVLFIAAILAVCAAMITGLVLIDGPFQSRRDRFDAQRYAELVTLAKALRCASNLRLRDVSLPAELTVESLRGHCISAGISADDLSDNETGTPYVYDRRNAQDFSICATFHDAWRTVQRTSGIWPHSSFDPKTGCASGPLR